MKKAHQTRQIAVPDYPFPPFYVTPQHHNTYTPPMAHAWVRFWGIRGSLGEACKCLCIARYKDTQPITFPILSRNPDTTYVLSLSLH